MNSDQELSQMFAAERAERPANAAFSRGFEQLQHALQAQATVAPVAHGPLKLGLSLVAKWGLGSGLAVFAVLSATVGLGAKAAPLAQHTGESAVETASSRSVEREPERGKPALPELAPTPLPKAPGVATAARAKTEAPSASAASTFGEEVRLIKAAKRELDAGRDQRAAALLNEHARLYPGGIFQSERDALEVLMECRRSPELGRAAAQQFLGQNAGSPLVERIARACGLATGATPTNKSFPEAPGDK